MLEYAEDVKINIMNTYTEFVKTRICSCVAFKSIYSRLPSKDMVKLIDASERIKKAKNVVVGGKKSGRKSKSGRCKMELPRSEIKERAD
jgi:hypothetical protein